MNISNKIKFLIILSIIFLVQGCATVQIKKMQLKTDMRDPTILNLCNYGDNQIDLFKQSENLVKEYLVKNVGEEYGYYVIKHNTQQENDTLASVTVASFLFPLALVGLPISFKAFSLQAKLYVFDSQGFLVKEYEDTCYFKYIGGLYYGYNLTKKIAKKYSRMYEGIFEVAMSQASEINGALKQSGIITEKNEKIAKANIEAFFKKKGETHKKTYVVSVKKPPINFQGEPENNKIQGKEKKHFTVSDFNEGLEVGKYYCMQNPNLRIQMLFGIFTLSNGDEAIAIGNYKRHGNKLVVSVYEGEFKGQTFTYIIEDSKHFHHSFENENWVHESAY